MEAFQADDAAQATSEFGEPVFVNGVRDPDLAIKRFLVYGPGRNGLDARKLQILMDHEREIRVDRGARGVLRRDGRRERGRLWRPRSTSA